MKLILALGGAVLVAGCSSVPTQQVADNDVRMVCDKERMSRIQAKSQGQPSHVDVIWVNCPQIRSDRVKST